jgi:hypothetical protein
MIARFFVAPLSRGEGAEGERGVLFLRKPNPALVSLATPFTGGQDV